MSNDQRLRDLFEIVHQKICPLCGADSRSDSDDQTPHDPHCNLDLMVGVVDSVGLVFEDYDRDRPIEMYREDRRLLVRRMRTLITVLETESVEDVVETNSLLSGVAGP